MTLWHGLSGIIFDAQVLILPVAMLTLAVSALVVVSGWNRRRDLLIRQGQPASGGRFELGQMAFESGMLDVAAEANAVLRQFESLAAGQFVVLELAVQPDLGVRADPRAFREILADLVRTAIEQSPCGRVLLGAAKFAGRVQITVSDDGAAADRGLRISRLRTAERLAALHGATMEVDARAGQGTTVFLRLPSSEPGRRSPAQATSAAVVNIWAPAPRASEPVTTEPHGVND